MPHTHEDPGCFGSEKPTLDEIQITTAMIFISVEKRPIVCFEQAYARRRPRQKIEAQYGKAQRIWVMDRGIATEKVLGEMRQADSSGKRHEKGWT